MHVILPTSNMIQNFLDTVNMLAASHGYQRITREQSANVIFTMAEEAVFNRLYWTVKCNRVEEVLQQTVPFWTLSNQVSPACVSSTLYVYRQCIEKAEIHLERILDQIMGEPETDAMWMVWHTLKIGDDLILERGSDYRVIDQTRPH